MIGSVVVSADNRIQSQNQLISTFIFRFYENLNFQKLFKFRFVSLHHAKPICSYITENPAHLNGSIYSHKSGNSTVRHVPSSSRRCFESLLLWSLGRFEFWYCFPHGLPVFTYWSSRLGFLSKTSKRIYPFF